DDVAERVRGGWEDEEIHVCEFPCQFLPAEDSGEAGVWQVGLKPGLLIALANNHEFEILPARLQEGRADVRQEADVLFGGETTYVPNSESPRSAVAAGGRE